MQAVHWSLHGSFLVLVNSLWLVTCQQICEGFEFRDVNDTIITVKEGSEVSILFRLVNNTRYKDIKITKKDDGGLYCLLNNVTRRCKSSESNCKCSKTDRDWFSFNVTGTDEYNSTWTWSTYPKVAKDCNVTIIIQPLNATGKTTTKEAVFPVPSTTMLRGAPKQVLCSLNIITRRHLPQINETDEKTTVPSLRSRSQDDCWISCTDFGLQNCSAESDTKNSSHYLIIISVWGFGYGESTGNNQRICSSLKIESAKITSCNIKQLQPQQNCSAQAGQDMQPTVATETELDSCNSSSAVLDDQSVVGIRLSMKLPEKIQPLYCQEVQMKVNLTVTEKTVITVTDDPRLLYVATVVIIIIVLTTALAVVCYVRKQLRDFASRSSQLRQKTEMKSKIALRKPGEVLTTYRKSNVSLMISNDLYERSNDRGPAYPTMDLKKQRNRPFSLAEGDYAEIDEVRKTVKYAYSGVKNDTYDRLDHYVSAAEIQRQEREQSKKQLGQKSDVIFSSVSNLSVVEGTGGECRDVIQEYLSSAKTNV